MSNVNTLTQTTASAIKQTTKTLSVNATATVKPMVSKAAIALPTQLQVATTAFTIDGAVRDIESLRDQATKNHERYYVAGRKAMVKLIAQVYRVWHDAQVQDQFDALMNNVRRLLKDLSVDVRTNSPASSLLIRYVFSGIKTFSDKQVHVYGRSLNVAFAATPRVKPDDFCEFVAKTEGGFDGLREIGSDAGNSNASTTKRTPAVALNIASQEVTCETIAIDWPAEDAFRFYIAIRNADGTTADLKPALLSNESKDVVLLKFYDDREKRLNPPKKAISAANKVSLAQLKLKAASQRVALLELQNQAEEAKVSGTPEQCEKLLSAVKSAKVELDSLNSAVRTFSSQIKAD